MEPELAKDGVDGAGDPGLDSLVTRKLDELLENHPPDRVTAAEFFGARYDSGLAWTHYPPGSGGLGGTPGHHRMVAPTIAFHGTEIQRKEHLRSIYTGEMVWCQLFSEPGAGSDLAGLATRAHRVGESWRIDGQKVWTSLAHVAQWGLLLARTDPTVPKHRGLTCFLIDLKTDGVEVRPLRQITGEAEFNEVFFDNVPVDDRQRLGDVGDGWNVAMTTLMHERVAIGGAMGSRGSVPAQLMVSLLTSGDRANRGLVDRSMRLWIEAEIGRLMTIRSTQLAQAGVPGPVGSVNKLFGAEHNKHIFEFVVQLMGPSGMLYPRAIPTADGPVRTAFRSDPRVAFLRARANTIEGGTSEIMRNILAERILGLPREANRSLPWNETPK